MKKTEILDLIARKLAPFMLLFGLYLLSYGHLSPGGGFQGGVVISSGVILLALTRGATSVEALFPIAKLSVVETVTYLFLIAVGLSGMIFGAGFLGNPAGTSEAIAVPRVGFILILNIAIGVKVGAGISLICIYLLRSE